MGDAAVPVAVATAATGSDNSAAVVVWAEAVRRPTRTQKTKLCSWRICLAQLLQAWGDLAGAEPPMQEALQGQQETLGGEHEDTMDTMYGLARLLETLGRFDEAIPLFEAELRGCVERGDVQGAAGSAPLFRFLSPVLVRRLTPSRGPERGGTVVQVAGSGFDRLASYDCLFGAPLAASIEGFGSAVTVRGGVLATSPAALVSASALTCVAPAASAGVGPVVVSVLASGEDVTVDTGERAVFTYYPDLSAERVTPDRGGLSVRLLGLRAGDPAHSPAPPPPTCQRTPPPPPSSSRMGPPQTPPSGLVRARQLRSARARHDLLDPAPLAELGEGALPAPGHVLRAVVGQDLGRRTVAGDPSLEGLAHQGT